MSLKREFVELIGVSAASFLFRMIHLYRLWLLAMASTKQTFLRLGLWKADLYDV